MSGFNVIEGDVTIRNGADAVDVKPASTAAVAADKALVVAVSPNNTVPVSGPLTDTQLRATPVPVSGTVAVSNLPAVQPVSDNGGSLTVDDGGGSITVDATSLPLPTGAATEATLALVKAKTDNLDVALSTRVAEATFTARVGEVQATPTANTVLGRLKDLYDRFIAQLPAALVGGRLDTNTGSWLGSTAPTVGQKTMDDSVPVTLASNQSPLAVTFTSPQARTGVSAAFLTLGGGTANTLQVLRSTTYVEPAATGQRSIVSSSANDSAAGTGARTLQVSYFKNDGSGPFFETVTLNGTSPVNFTETDMRFIEIMEVQTAGSLGANAGTLSLYTGLNGTGTVIGTVGVGTILAGAGDGRTLWAHHYIAAGYRADFAIFSVGIQSGGSPTSGRFFVRKAEPLVANSAEVLLADIILLSGSFQRSFDFHPSVDGFSRITAYVVPTVNNATVSASFDWSEVPT